jgi:hypothetical protein
VIFGSKRAWWSSPIDLSSLNGKNGFILYGENAGDNSGISVASAGDVNDDGIDDFIIGAYRASPLNRTIAGRSYIIFGNRGLWNSPIELSSLNGKNGCIINGQAGTIYSGSSVAGAGDINNDGISDFIIGAVSIPPKARQSYLRSYVIFGSRKGWNSPFEFSSLNGKNGFMINGEPMGSASALSVAGAGDINDDGICDLVIGSSWASPENRTYAGESYVIFGEKTN